MKIEFSRESLCAGDDIYNGIYTLEIPGEMSLCDFIQILCKGGHGNDWPIPTHYHDSYWMIQSNIGTLAYLIYEFDNTEHIEYPYHNPNKTIAELDIHAVYACRPLPYWPQISRKNYHEVLTKLKWASEQLKPFVFPQSSDMTKLPQ